VRPCKKKKKQQTQEWANNNDNDDNKKKQMMRIESIQKEYVTRNLCNLRNLGKEEC
jgi:hypothetical protein